MGRKGGARYPAGDMVGAAAAGRIADVVAMAAVDEVPPASAIVANRHLGYRHKIVFIFEI